MVVAGVGMDHDKLVDLCRRYFVAEKKAIWEENKELLGVRLACGQVCVAIHRGNHCCRFQESVSQYTTGGIIAVGFQVCVTVHHRGNHCCRFSSLCHNTPQGESLL